MQGGKRDPRKDPQPGDIVGTTGEFGKKAKCFGLITTETEDEKEVSVLVKIAFTKCDFTGDAHKRTLEQWIRLVKGAEVLHVAE